MNDYSEIQFPTSVEEFFWENPCIFIYSASFILYIFVTLLNIFRLKKNSV